MITTRGDLQPARIYEVDAFSFPTGEPPILCMFNPHEYVVSKSNTFERDPKNNADVMHITFRESGEQQLVLNLLFDTFEEKTDVSLITNRLWKLMEVKTRRDRKDTEKVEPPYVAFEWGVFRFIAVITSMTQRFTLFLPSGLPVRAKVDITFSQFDDKNDYPGQNPTSGAGAVEQQVQIIAGDRIDTIAAKVYGDAGKWHMIAEHNKIADPLKLQTGQWLMIPDDNE